MRAPVLVLAALLLLTACGPGQGVAPGAGIPRNEGANADLREVHLRNAFLLKETSGELALHVVLINNQPQADRLEELRTQTGTATLSAPVELGPSQAVGADRAIATVSGISAGGPVATTFRFRDAGQVTLQVPIKERTDFYQTYSPATS